MTERSGPHIANIDIAISSTVDTDDGNGDSRAAEGGGVPGAQGGSMPSASSAQGGCVPSYSSNGGSRRGAAKSHRCKRVLAPFGGV